MILRCSTIQLGLKEYNVYQNGEIFDIKRNRWQKLNKDGNGYKRFSFPIGYKPYKQDYILVHQLVAIAFLNHKPDGMNKQIDHINGDVSNNQVQNLRIVTCRQNQANRMMHRKGRLFGCYYKKVAKKWQSQVMINGKIKYLGLFKTQEEAHERYVEELLKQKENNE